MSSSVPGQRLAGARLAAGIGVRAAAAEMMGISGVRLLRYEAGDVQPDALLLATAGQMYGVSVEFLSDGAVLSKRDRLAQRIAGLLSQTIDGDDIDTAMAARLRLIRTESGFPSGARAVAALGLTQATYLAHENASRRIPIERAVVYALQFQARPEFLLMGDGPIFPTHSDPVRTWSPYRAVQDRELVRPVSWRWLRKRSGDSGLVFPVLLEESGTLKLMPEMPICIPAPFLPEGLPSGPVYGIRRPDGRIWIVDPNSSIGEVVALTGLGTRRTNSTEDQAPNDILRVDMPLKEEIILGLLVGEIAFSSSASG